MNLDFLIEMGWKSALIAAAALAAGLLLKSRSAQDKAAMLRLAVGLILLLPLISLMGPALRMENPMADTAPILSAPASDPEATRSVVAEAAPSASHDMAVVSPAAMSRSATTPEAAATPADDWSMPYADDPAMLAGLVYLAGVLLLGLRLAGGYVTLQRWTWAAREVQSPKWRRALERARDAAGDKRGTRLLLSESVPAPLSWGWAQPVILIDPETFARPEDADAVLAHEMAHIVRTDWLALMLSRLSVALFWFNPFIWMLEREMVQQSEEAADAQAVGQVEPARYAQTLMSCVMHSRGGVVPANSIRPSRSGLSRRIYAVLDGRARAIRSGSRWTLAAMLGCTAFAAPLAALELTAPELPAVPRAPAVAEIPAVPTVRKVAVASGDRRTVVTSNGVKIVYIGEGDGVKTPVAPVPPVRPMDARRNDAMDRAHGFGQRAVDRAMADLDRDLADLGPRIEAATRIAVAQSVDGKAIAIAAQREARKALAKGAVDMKKGAVDLRKGARDLDREADRLADYDYREKQIRRAQAEGRRLTHEELINAIPDLRDGAKDMEKGADDMERQAERMRDGN